MGKYKETRKDGISSEVFKSVIEILPRYITALYNGSLLKGMFLQRWKIALLIPVNETGKTENEEASKFRPTRLLDTYGNVLEVLLINRIMY